MNILREREVPTGTCDRSYGSAISGLFTRLRPWNRFLVKTCARIPSREMDLTGRSPPSYFNVSYPLCFAELWRASCRTRKRPREMSTGTNLGRQFGRVLLELV